MNDVDSVEQGCWIGILQHVWLFNFWKRVRQMSPAIFQHILSRTLIIPLYFCWLEFRSVSSSLSLSTIYPCSFLFSVLSIQWSTCVPDVSMHQEICFTMDLIHLLHLCMVQFQKYSGCCVIRLFMLVYTRH